MQTKIVRKFKNFINVGCLGLCLSMSSVPFKANDPLIELDKAPTETYYDEEELGKVYEPIIFLYEAHGNESYSIEASKILKTLKNNGFERLFIECIKEHEKEVKDAYNAYLEGKLDKRIDILNKILIKKYVEGTDKAYMRLIKTAAEIRMEVACIDVGINLKKYKTYKGIPIFKTEQEAQEKGREILLSREVGMLRQIIEEIKKGRRIAVFIGFTHARSDYALIRIRYMKNEKEQEKHITQIKHKTIKRMLLDEGIPVAIYSYGE